MAEMDANVAPAVEAKDLTIASRRHTVIFLLIVSGISAIGALQQSRSGISLVDHKDVVPLYLSLTMSEWALAWYVAIGIRKHGSSVREILGGRWNSAKSVLLDVGIASLFWPVFMGAAKLLHMVAGPESATPVTSLLPQSPVEVLLWIILSLSAGLCEEFIFRGYLQIQFQALSGSSFVAVAGQALVFGVAHGYQGAKQVIIISVLGALFGLLAHWRKSVRPGILAHAWTDIFSGIILRH